MKNKVWGINVIGRQGVNAENDFSIGSNDAGDDVIVKIKDAELTGAEFATLKEIAEGGPTPGGGGFPEQDLNDPTFVPEANHYYQQKDGEQPEPESQFTDGVLYFYDGEEYHAITGEGGSGGGMPDPKDAEDGDVIKVTVTPAEYEGEALRQGDVLDHIWAKIDENFNWKDLTYNDERFIDEFGLPVCPLITGTIDDGGGQQGTFTVAVINESDQMVEMLLLAGSDIDHEQPIDPVYYLGGSDAFKEEAIHKIGFWGWNDNATGQYYIEDGYLDFCRMESWHGTFTIGSTSDQELWRNCIGKQKPFVKVKDEIKKAGWGQPYPAFTKAGQVLTSAGESYMLMPTNKKIPLSGPGRFYFNTDLSIDQMDENLGMMVRDGMSGMELRIRNTKDESEYSLAIGGKKDEHDEYAVRYIAYSKDPGNGDDPTFSWVYATADYDIDAEGTTLHMTHGWNQEEINNCTWDGDSYTYVKAISYDYSMVLPIYGSMLTIQEGLYYGDIKNAKTEWKALTIKDKFDYGTGHWNGMPAIGEDYTLGLATKEQIKNFLGINNGSLYRHDVIISANSSLQHIYAFLSFVDKNDWVSLNSLCAQMGNNLLPITGSIKEDNGSGGPYTLCAAEFGVFDTGNPGEVSEGVKFYYVPGIGSNEFNIATEVFNSITIEQTHTYEL